MRDENFTRITLNISSKSSRRDFGDEMTKFSKMFNHKIDRERCLELEQVP